MSNNGEINRVSELSKEEKERLEKVMKKATEFEQNEEMDLMRQPLEGQLLKFTNVVQGWQGRWFILDPQKGEMRYYLKEDHKVQHKVRGRLQLVGAVVSPSDEDSLAFTVVPIAGDNYKLKASTTRQRQEWINRLRTISEDHRQKRMRNVGIDRSSQPSDSIRRGTGTNDAVFRQLHRVISVAADQQQAMCRAVDALPNEQGLDDHVLLLKATSQSLLDTLDQCQHLVMQFSGSSRTASNESGHSDHSRSEPSHHTPHPVFPTTNSVGPDEIQRGIEVAEDALLSEPVHEPSEDEEVLDNDNFEDRELESIDQFKSLILNSLASLKLGTDLTRLSLPTFILQSRSFLESSSDFLANSQLLLAVPEQQTPELRMVQLLKWYLSSFRSGCKNGLVKKPYNPVLGEVFQCTWRTKSADSCNKIKVFAEQVSHHPPVSAIYAHCNEKALHLNAYVWPKSKFMGISLSAAMLGEGQLLIGTRLNRPTELYSFGFPTAYARSILSMPWFELGGKVELNCQQTGLSSIVTFHTKPFYGGKLHKISAEVKNSIGNVFCKVQGEWNGKLEFSYADGSVEVVDSSVGWNCERLIRPIDKQSLRESRRLWRDVTVALRANDISLAAERRRLLEEGQRLRNKKNKQMTYQSKYFQQNEKGAWINNQFPTIFND